MKKINIGWIGSGFVGQVAHLNNFSSLKNVKIVGLDELRTKLGQIACDKFNIIYSDKNSYQSFCKNSQLASLSLNWEVEQSNLLSVYNKLK